MNTASTIDVLVVGAGPTGLTMASELMRYGVSCRIIDKLPSPSPFSKALGIQVRTLETFEDMGVIEPFLAEGVRLKGVNLYGDGKQLAHIRFDNIDLSDLPYPFGVILPQSHTERILMAHLAKQGGAVERPKELLKFTQNADGIEAVLQCADGTQETVHAAYIVACDGASSTIRQSLGLSFGGDTYKEAFWAADVTLDNELPTNEVNTIFHPDGLMMMFPLYPERRVYRLAMNVDTGEPTDKRPQAPTIEQVQEVVQKRAPFALTITETHWLSAFRIHHRKIDQYRSGRVFLCGDAAHIHSPMGGQGMNTGIQDAYNLAWKIAAVQKGLAGKKLLESYHEEREPIASDLLKATDRMTKGATIRNPLMQKIRNRLVPLVAGTEMVQEKMMRTMGELNINYRDTGFVAQNWHGRGGDVEAGDRAPDAVLVNSKSGTEERLFEVYKDIRHIALLFTGTNPSEADVRNLRRIAHELREDYGAMLDIRYIAMGDSSNAILGNDGTPLLLDTTKTAHERYEVSTTTALYLIRPDGYIGYRSSPSDIEGVIEYMNRVLGVTPEMLRERLQENALV
jgi:2-polyprenyl-6-methoxyphenol hydroxylase-like FAD-dependent oxidoreductase